MYEKADDNFKRAIELEPDSGNIYVHRGYVCCIVKLCSSFTGMWSHAVIVPGVLSLLLVRCSRTRCRTTYETLNSARTRSDNMWRRSDFHCMKCIRGYYENALYKYTFVFDFPCILSVIENWQLLGVRVGEWLSDPALELSSSIMDTTRLILPVCDKLAGEVYR